MGKAFGTAGVRGVFNSTQTPEEVYRLAETVAFVSGLGGYAVGWDGRKSSALLARVVASAINAVGSTAFSFGMVPTPVVAWGTRSRSCLAGFSVTASHNPPEFSGVKVFDGKGMELSKADEERVERALGVDVMKSSGRFGALVQDEWAIDDYVQALVGRYEVVSDPLRIAIDCSSGPGGLVTPRVLKSLGHDVVALNAQISWRFPAHYPEPTAENLADLSKMAPQANVDFVFAHDGDADRLVMIDAQGNLVPDSILAILALKGLDVSSGTVVLSENTSNAVSEEAERIGLRVVRSRVGKAFSVLESEGGVFATEPSKIVDPRWGFWEDGINAAALICNALSRDRGLLARTMGECKWSYRQVNVNVEANMTVLVDKAREAFKRLKVIEERTLDGCKFVFSDGSWAMFRRSGTEMKTRMYCESSDPQLLEVLIQQGTTCIESSL